MTVTTVLDYRHCIEHFERVRRRYYKMRTNKDANAYQINASIKYFNSRIRYYKARIRLLREW